MTPQQTLTKIINSIIDPSYVDNFQINQIDSPIAGITQLDIQAESAIIGQIIGKQGKIIKSLRIIMAMAYPNQRFNIQVNNLS